MTREHKLALIVGFSLILLVGVLISDHLSRARQARIVQVPDETRIADATVPPPADPLRTLEALTPAPGEPERALAAAPVQAGPPAPLAPEPTASATERLAASAPARSLDEAVRREQPVRVAAAGGDTGLIELIQGSGGTVDRDRNGGLTFRLPEAAGTTMSKPAAGVLGTSERAEAEKHGTSPIAKAAALETEKVRLHAVQKGDTLFEIAARYYGTGHLWQELAKFNGIKDKDGAVRIGTRLKIPSKDALLGRVASSESGAAPVTPVPAGKSQPKKPETTPLRSVRTELASYTVKRGESLGLIARKTLGSAKRWPEIADLNKIEDEDHVPAGTVLKIPAGARG